MYTADEIRSKTNMYIYMLNKYNVYGIFAVYWLSWYMSLIVLPQNAGIKTFFQTVSLMLLLSFGIKYAILIICGLRDACECNLDEKDYIHPKRETCPVEENIFGVYSDIRYLIEETAINVGFRYNFAALIAFIAFASSFGLFKITQEMFGFFNLTAVIAIAVATKFAVNYFFVIQDYCPCACRYKAPKVSETGTCKAPSPKEVSEDVDIDVDQMRQGLISKDDILATTNLEIDRIIQNKQSHVGGDELEQAIENEIKRMVPEQSFEGRLQKMCSIVSDKLRRYDTVENCLQDVNSNENAKKTVYKMLMDDGTYSCLNGSSNQSQFDLCFKDYFSRNPQFLLRLVDAFPNGSK